MPVVQNPCCCLTAHIEFVAYLAATCHHQASRHECQPVSEGLAGSVPSHQLYQRGSLKQASEAGLPEGMLECVCMWSIMHLSLMWGSNV